MIGDICILEYQHKRDEIARKNDTSQKIILVLSKLILAILSFNISYCFFRVVQKQLKLHVNCYFDKIYLVSFDICICVISIFSASRLGMRLAKFFQFLHVFRLVSLKHQGTDS